MNNEQEKQIRDLCISIIMLTNLRNDAEKGKLNVGSIIDDVGGAIKAMRSAVEYVRDGAYIPTDLDAYKSPLENTITL